MINKGQLAGLMRQAQQMQENMQKMQELLASVEVEGQSGAGLVKVTMTCKHDVKRVTIIPSGGGRHEWRVNGDLVFSKAAEDRHPDMDELKALIYAKMA